MSGFPPDEAAGWVTVVRLGRARGLRGEIYGDVWNPPERYGWLKRVWIRNREGNFLFDGRPLEVLEARPCKGRLILRLASICTADAAQQLTGCEAVVPRGELPPLPEGEYYLSDLVGCTVFERRTGAPAGTVSGWQDFGGSILLEMEPAGAPGGDPVWIPLTHSICVEIRPAERRIVVDPPEGLLELNRPAGAGHGSDDDLSRAHDLPGVLPRAVRARRHRPRPEGGPRRDPHP
ncbi:MAG: ribosome maturation factor RimM [Bryobacteraceae bacterium]|nr:ribosome maturation factor RimM [Bryobacteraceae bacterium]MCX7603932.1 ribosome maturation factor RimM [Bryobacteraceae bacterium]